MTMSETIRVCAKKVPPMTARQRLIVVLLLGANFMMSADFSILNIALPVVGEAVGLSVDNLPWVSTAFALPAAGLSLLFGRLGDLHGRRRIFSTAYPSSRPRRSLAVLMEAGLVFLTTLYLQNVLHFGPLPTCLVFGVPGLASVAAGVVAGRIIARRSARVV